MSNQALELKFDRQCRLRFMAGSIMAALCLSLHVRTKDKDVEVWSLVNRTFTTLPPPEIISGA